MGALALLHTYSRDLVIALLLALAIDASKYYVESIISIPT